jgi:hypothetical protein
MARKERGSKGKTMRPNYFVFCEGETEVVYTEMLRSQYRLPIHIIAKKTLQNVTSALVERCKAVYVQTVSDKTYLMYDLDVTDMLERLQKVSGAELLCSNPCFELWLLLHYDGVKAAITSAECAKKLSAAAKQYKKGILSDEMIKHLYENADKAIKRAKDLQIYGNPSTTVYLLIEELNRLKKEEVEAELMRNRGKSV